MILAIAHLTLRECFRRPFPYVASACVILLALCSHLFQGFSFGHAELEAANLAIAATFLGGLLHAAFVATAAIHSDFDRGTLGLMFSQPVSPAAYLLGRYAGLVISATLMALAVAAAMVAIFALPLSRAPLAGVFPYLASGAGRVVAPLLVLEAAALAASALFARIAAPFALLAFFLAGTLAQGPILRVLLPDFSVFALEAGPGIRPGLAIAYAAMHSTFLLGLGYLAVTGRPPLRSQT